MKNDYKKYFDKYITIITWSEEDQGYGVEVPELVGCFSFGKTKQAALRNIKTAIRLWVEAALKNGDEIPLPSANKTYSGKFNLRLDASLHRTLAIKATQSRKSLNALCAEILQGAL